MESIMITKRKLINKFKRAHKSSTIWFNLVGAGILGGLLLDPVVTAWLMSNGFTYVLVLGNIALRLKTDKPVEDK